jgi:hypothetical protein
MADYALVNSTTGLIENITIWDGVTPWDPPAGFTAEEIPSGDFVIIGYYYLGGTFQSPSTYYSTLQSTLGQQTQVSPEDPQPADTTDLVPPFPSGGNTLYWWTNNAPSDQWATAWFNPNTYWSLSTAKTYLTKQVESSASAALNNQLRDYSNVEILTAPNIDNLICADYTLTYGVYRDFIDTQKAAQAAILAAAVDVADLFTYNPSGWSTSYPSIASGVIFTGRGAGFGPQDLNVSNYSEFNSESLAEADTELYVPGTDTVLPYVVDPETGEGYFDSPGNCFNPGDYLIQIRQVSDSFVIAEFEVPLNPAGEDVFF